MARQTRAIYLQSAGRADTEALATIASGENPDGTEFSSVVGLNADARTGKLTSGTWTLASGVVESVTVPSWARGFRLRPTADIRFAISEDPVAAGAEALTAGATAFANENEVRLLEPISGTVTVRMLATGATTVAVSFF